VTAHALSLLLLLTPGKGELTHFGNQWAWSKTGEVFVPQLLMYATPPHIYANPAKVDGDIETFLFGHGFNGFHVFVSCRWFDIEQEDCRKIPGRDPPLDPRVFDALELLIRKTHRAGGMVHLWMWGDEQRGETPSARPDWGGLGGPVEHKVEREIARRLGPLPGWSLGYGFDLDEWASANELRKFRKRLHKLLPSFHFLGGRAGGPNQDLDHRAYQEWNRPLDYAGYEHHRPSYAVYVAALQANPDKPVLSEDRFRVMASSKSKHYSLEDVRRGLWHSTLAGGVGNIWGYLLEGGSHDLGSAPFPNREAIRTHFEFLRGRFLKGMKRCSPPRARPQETALCLAQGPRRLLYKEDASRVELPPVEGLPAIAVDTRRAYEEIAIATGGRVWEAPYESDWAIAAGDFERGTQRAPGEAARITAALGAEPGNSVREIRVLLGTVAEIQAEGLSEPARAAAAAFEAIEEVEASLSIWDSGSEISLLNARREAVLSALAFDAIESALEIAWESDGAFDPTLVDKGHERVHLGRKMRSVRLEPGLRLDLGAIVKGYAVDRALESLRSSGARSALVDLGTSSIALFGDRTITFEIRNPKGGRPPASFRLREGAIGSSSDEQRGSHIVDPRSGRPGTGVLAVTVVARTAAEADALSTAVYVLGPRRGIALLEARAADGVVVLEEKGRMVLVATEGFAQRYSLEVAEGVESRSETSSGSGAGALLREAWTRNTASASITAPSVIWRRTKPATLSGASDGSTKRTSQPADSSRSAPRNAARISPTFGARGRGTKIKRWVRNRRTNPTIGRCMCVVSSIEAAERGGVKSASEPL
jgi:thiamine biosynthesis lipoprotein ApbE